MNEMPPPVPVAQPKTSGLAITSLVLSILGVVLLLACIGPLFAIPGVICGHIAHSRVKRSGGALTGGGMALGGIITGYVCIALGIFLIPMMAAIAIPNFVKAREAAMRNACINNLRQIDAAKQLWALDANKANDTTVTPTSTDLNKHLKNGFSNMKCPKGGTYTINTVGEEPACSIPGHSLTPTDPSHAR